MNNLTNLQQKLLKDLATEFEKLNPKPKPQTGGKRFTIETIGHCISEEERIKQTVAKHNLTMMKVFIGQMKDEFKSFHKEFGKLFTLQIGYNTPNYQYNIDSLEERTKAQPLYVSTSNEVYIFIVSKKKRYTSNDSRYNYCNNMSYIKIFAHFKTQNESVEMESGKKVSLPRIVGVEYSNCDYLNSYSGKVVTHTLDELIQRCTSIQQSMVEYSA